MEAHKRLHVLVVSLVATVPPTPVAAELKDYQIARMIMLKSECQLNELDRHVNSDGSVRFKATCKNESFYPDGIEITCPDVDSDDERTCSINTKKKSFQNLELLQRAQD